MIKICPVGSEHDVYEFRFPHDHGPILMNGFLVNL
jgi:hypothetical protein